MITKYDVLNPKPSLNKPYFNQKDELVIPYIKTPYKYFIEGARYNLEEHYKDYFLLLGKTKFDKSCRRCRVDDYGRLILNLHSEIKEYLKFNFTDGIDIKITYIETEEDYDVFSVI